MFSRGFNRGFGRAAARLARRGRKASNTQMQQRGRAALNSKMPTPPKRDTSEAALKKAMEKRYKQSLANKANVAERNRINPTRVRSSRPNNARGVTQGGIPQASPKPKTPTWQSARPNNMRGVTQGGIPARRAPTQADVMQQAKQIAKQNQPKQQSQPSRYRRSVGTPPIRNTQPPNRFPSPEERAAVLKALTRKGQNFSEGGSVRTPKSNFGTTDYRKTGMTTHTSVRSRKK